MPRCEKCKHGIVQLTNYNDWKAKKISKLEFSNVAREYGAKCFPCLHNGITGRKAAIYRKITANWLMEKMIPFPFQSVDLFEKPEETERDDIENDNQDIE